MIPAIAGEAAEVPPIRFTVLPEVSVGSEVAVADERHGPQSVTHMKYALPRKPFPAKKETSGRSRFPSAGIPETPVCHDGLLYPLAVQVPIVVVVLLFVVQLLFPPPAPTESTKADMSTCPPEACKTV